MLLFALIFLYCILSIIFFVLVDFKYIFTSFFLNHLLAIYTDSVQRVELWGLF